MKLAKTCKVFKAAAKDASRYAVNDVWLETEGEGAPCLVATDGRGIAVVPVGEIEPGETAGPISAKAIQEACKGKGDTARVVANGSVEVQAVAVGPTVSFPR